MRTTADDLVAAVYRYGSRETAQELGGFHCFRVPYSLTGDDGTLRRLLPVQDGSIVAPWARPPYENILITSELDDDSGVIICRQVPTEKHGRSQIPQDSPWAGERATWAIEATHIGLSEGGRAVAIFGAVLIGIARGDICVVTHAAGDDATREWTITALSKDTATLSDISAERWSEKLRLVTTQAFADAIPTGHSRLEGQLHAAISCLFALCNCKNVQQVEIYPSRQMRRAAERDGRPRPFTVKTLVIEQTHTQSELPSGTTNVVMPLHWTRGHFKTFTEQRRLFGKHIGTYWWDPNLSGNKRRGVVVKDYEVRPK